jgi:hypothetical protein
MSEIGIGNVSVKPGTKARGFLKVANRVSGAPIGVPFFVVNGAEKGPVLCVDGCVHGDEYEGSEAVMNLGKTLKPEELKGILIGVPVVNVAAFEAETRADPFDHERLNLNRVFPGDANGFITQRIAYAYFNEIIRKSNYYITFHGGGKTEYLCPLVQYQPSVAFGNREVGEQSQRLARAFGVEIIWKAAEEGDFPGDSIAEAEKIGIPSICPELGAKCDRYRNRRLYVDMCMKGVLNVMKHLDMIEGQPELPSVQTEVRGHIQHSDTGGLWIPEVMASDFVKKGDVIGRIVDPFYGDELNVVRASCEGIVVCIWAVPIIRAGEWTCFIGEVLSRIENRKQGNRGD